MTKLEEHEAELRDVTARLEEVQARIKNLRREEEDLVAGKQAWEAIVAMERKRMPGSPEISVIAQEPLESTTQGTDDDEMRDFDYDDAEEEEGENKTQFVRDFIQKNAAFGMTANDLKAAAANAGMKHPPSWPYGPIQRLKKKGEIVKRRGRFYPAKGPASRVNLALVG